MYPLCTGTASPYSVAPHSSRPYSLIPIPYSLMSIP